MKKNSKIQNVFEALGREMVRSEQEQKEMDEFVEISNDVASKLRVVADCLDFDNPAEIQGFVDDRYYAATCVRDAHLSVHETSIENPYKGFLFEIPADIQVILKQVLLEKCEMYSRQDRLAFLLHSAQLQSNNKEKMRNEG